MRGGEGARQGRTNTLREIVICVQRKIILSRERNVRERRGILVSIMH